MESEVVEVSVVIPVYDSPVLEQLVAEIERVLAGQSENYEVILIDDRSPSAETWEILQRLAAERKRVRALQLTRNFGQQAATLCGLAESRGQLVITMDDDFQHNPQDIPRLLAYADHDVVIAQFPRRRHHVLKRISSRIKGWFDQVLIGKPKGLQMTSFRLLKRTVVDGVLSIRTANPFLPALIFAVTRDIFGVLVTHGERGAGRSGYTLGKMVTVFSNLLINNSSAMLRLVGCMGLSFALASFCLGGIVVYRKLFLGIAVQGWASLFVAVTLIGGVLLFSLGVVGEYLIRIIQGTEHRPAYLVRRRA